MHWFKVFFYWNIYIFSLKKVTVIHSFVYLFGLNEMVTSFFPLQGRPKCNGCIVSISKQLFSTIVTNDHIQ
jgi:hypothetical protein